MSVLTAEQRGDLAEQILPVAAHLAVLVHGDGGPEDVAEVLAGLDDTSKNALIVALAGLVDPEQPVKKALGWLDFNEHGNLTVPASWSESRSVRDLAPEPAEGLDDEYVDHVAVTRFVSGFPVCELNDAEFLEAVRQCVAQGMSLPDVDRLRGWRKKTAEGWVNRLRKRFDRNGEEFPDLGLRKPRVFTREEVVAMRERAADGATLQEVGLAFDASRDTVRAICSGKRYPHYGGPIRVARGSKSVAASQEFGRGHGDNSQAALVKHEMKEVA
ncbi:hypothetical protein ACFC08_28585 [Streptomyces sp. NPDC056112]|uniref:hypothetical protein n=1 Tax=Streptomyces sp. NPDC056112 TaxID=3345715 RepID=UPI0035DCECD2